MGVQLTDEMIQSWEKYGQENVLLTNGKDSRSKGY